VVFSVFASLAALSSGGSLNWCDNPARAGSMFTVYLNGVPKVLGASYPVAGNVTDSNAGSIGAWRPVG
jgi:hypothetical protein